MSKQTTFASANFDAKRATDHQFSRKPRICLLILFAYGVLHAQQQTAVVYPNAAPLVHADAYVDIAKAYDHTPHGAIGVGTLLNRPACTGDISNAKTNLQHYHYDPVTGPFLNTNAAPAVPRELSCMNQHAYVDDNPITRDDPSGSYIIRLDINAQNLSPSAPKGQKLLQNALAFYDKEGEVNDGTVDLEENPKFVGEMNSAGKTTFNAGSLHSNSNYLGPSFRAEAEAAATATHEEQYGADGQFFGHPLNQAGGHATENKAYLTESYVNEGLNYGLWHSGWRGRATNNEHWAHSAEENANDPGH